MKLDLIDVVLSLAVLVACSVWGIIAIINKDWDQATVAVLILILSEPKGA